jgi:cell division protein FtsW
MLRPGHFIALIVLALLTLGVLMVNSADMQASSGVAEPPAVSLETIAASRSAAYMVLAVAALALGALTPVRRLAEHLISTPDATPDAGSRDTSSRAVLRRLALVTLLLLGICALVYIPGLSREINGARRWLRLPVPGLGDALSFQPSEVAKWGMVALMAWYAAAIGPTLRSLRTGLLPALACVGIVGIVIIKEDLGTGTLIVAVAGIILLAAGARFVHFLAFVPPAVAGLAYAIASSDYRVRRLTAFLDPYTDPEGIGYHTIQSLIAIANGEIFGRGLGHGLQKFGYLPEDRTDFIFCVICEELGLAGAALVCSLFTGLVWAGAAIIRREENPFLRLFSLGVLATVALQAVVNLAVVTGLAPTKGIALPLVSSGGTGWVLTSFCLGLVIAAERTQRRAEEGAPEPAGIGQTTPG